MKTDELMARLAQDPAPVPRHTAMALLLRGLSFGAAAALILVIATLGPRHSAPLAQWTYWAKFAYPLALAIASLALVDRLARPGMQTSRNVPWLIVPAAVIAAGALWQWSGAPEAERTHLFFGHSYRVCAFLIVVTALPIFAGVIWAMRRLAPTRPVAAGAAAGLLAGGAGAWIYAFHCNESSLVFVAVWYTAGIALAAVLGALAGRSLLRW